MSRRWAFGMVGAGGMGRALMSFIPQSLNVPEGDRLERVAFVEAGSHLKMINDVQCLSDDEFLALPMAGLGFAVSVGDSRLRQQLTSRYLSKGAVAWSVVHPSALVGDGNSIGQGAVICAFSTITANVTIGAMFQCNLYSYVEHDCVIGDYVTFAPGVHCNGNVRIDDHAYIGSGAIIRNGQADRPLTIGEGAIVGQGAVVLHDVAAYTTVVGNPARPLKAKDPATGRGHGRS